MSASQKWTALTSEEILSKIKFGSGPKIVIKSLTGSFGYFSKTENLNVINIDQEWVNGLETANLKSTQQATAFLLGVTVLHEYVHQSRSENNLSNDYEYGEVFENSAYGLVIRASNASTYSYRMYKK